MLIFHVRMSLINTNLLESAVAAKFMETLFEITAVDFDLQYKVKMSSYL